MPGASVMTIASFPTSTGNGTDPDGQLFIDSNGDLFGATVKGGADDAGTTYEIAKGAGGYATTPTFLADIPSGLNTLVGVANLSADANGDLFGLEIAGGTNSDGAIVEFPNTGGSPVTLASFTGGAGGSQPAGQLFVDANGNLFGITAPGEAGEEGVLYELQKTDSGYLATPTVLANFSSTIIPFGSTNLVEDAAGDFFGVTTSNTVFEIKKTGDTYAAPVLLVAADTFPTGTEQLGSLTIDSEGDIFGTTTSGGADGYGDVFEIEKTATGYASTPTILASFTAADGQISLNHPKTLIVDANGDLFGTTDPSSGNSGGVVFEIVRRSTGYESTPTIIANFNGDADAELGASLVADSNGDLFGTTQSGGTINDGTVFEITDSGYATSSTVTPIIDDLLWQNTSTGQASLWEMDATTRIGGGAVSVNPGPAWTAVGTGDFFSSDTSDILWQNTSTGEVSVWEMNGSTRTGGGAVSVNPGPSWKAVGTGEFYGNTDSDILFQNSSTGQAAIWDMDGSTRTGGGAVSVNPGTSWKAVGTGDFTDDGFSDDILWQNTSTGQVSIWEMDGSARTGGGAVSVNPGPAWKAIGTGDFYGDGDSDILFQNTSTGQLSIWEMDGSTRTGGGAVSVNPGVAWQAIGTGAGGSDILFQNTSTGQVSIWEMTGNTRSGGGAVTPVPGTSWRAVDLT
jgi:hypothetical protein